MKGWCLGSKHNLLVENEDDVPNHDDEDFPEPFATTCNIRSVTTIPGFGSNSKEMFWHLLPWPVIEGQRTRSILRMPSKQKPSSPMLSQWWTESEDWKKEGKQENWVGPRFAASMCIYTKAVVLGSSNQGPLWKLSVGCVMTLLTSTCGCRSTQYRCRMQK